MIGFACLVALVGVTACSAAETDYGIEDQFIGCYRGSIDGGGEYLRSSAMTLELCTHTCRRFLKTFAALQNGSVCRCSDDVRRHHPVADCHVTCSGHQQQYCGGWTGSASVYTSCPIGFYGESCSLDCNCLNRTQCDIRTGDCPNGCEADWSGSKCDTSTAAAFTIPSTYLGCWRDNYPISRDFENENFHFQATIETCSVFCRRKGYTYMGLQAYTECFCGNSYGEYGQRPDFECNTPCRRNDNQMCGGLSRNSVYSVCPIGFFGDDCTQACHCTTETRCFVTNGTCMSGECAQGWQGHACNMIYKPNCSDGYECRAEETCKMYNLKFTQVPRCECGKGYVRTNAWNYCIGLEKCYTDDDCNSMLDFNSTEIIDDAMFVPEPQPLTVNAADEGSWIAVVTFLVMSLIANVAFIVFMIFKSRRNAIWNPHKRYPEESDSNSM